MIVLCLICSICWNSVAWHSVYAQKIATYLFGLWIIKHRIKQKYCMQQKKKKKKQQTHTKVAKTLKIINIVIIHGKCNANVRGWRRFNAIHSSGRGKCLRWRRKISKKKIVYDADLFACTEHTAPVHSHSLLFNFISLILFFFHFFCVCFWGDRFCFVFRRIFSNAAIRGTQCEYHHSQPKTSSLYAREKQNFERKNCSKANLQKCWIVYEYNMWIVSFDLHTHTYTHSQHAAGTHTKSHPIECVCGRKVNA